MVVTWGDLLGVVGELVELWWFPGLLEAFGGQFAVDVDLVGMDMLALLNFEALVFAGFEHLLVCLLAFLAFALCCLFV